MFCHRPSLISIACAKKELLSTPILSTNRWTHQSNKSQSHLTVRRQHLSYSLDCKGLNFASWRDSAYGSKHSKVGISTLQRNSSPQDLHSLQSHHTDDVLEGYRHTDCCDYRHSRPAHRAKTRNAQLFTDVLVRISMGKRVTRPPGCHMESYTETETPFLRMSTYV